MSDTWEMFAATVFSHEKLKDYIKANEISVFIFFKVICHSSRTAKLHIMTLALILSAYAAKRQAYGRNPLSG